MDWASRELRFGGVESLQREPQKFLAALYQHLINNRLAFNVLELHSAEAHEEVRALLEGSNGWKQVLGFHLYRDSDNSTAYVFFI